MDANETRILIDGLCKQLMDKISAVNGKADAGDIAKAERILQLVKELEKS